MVSLEYDPDNKELKVSINEKCYKFKNEFIKITNEFIDGIYCMLKEIDENQNNIVKVYKDTDDILKIMIADDEETVNTNDLINSLVVATNKYFSKTSLELASNFHYERYQFLKNIVARDEIR